jgi:CubicO group peptidase (beta-lactamase class C family)
VRRQWLALFASALVIAGSASSQSTRRAQDTEPAVRIDAIFSKSSSTTPGCAVGVAVNGRVVVEKAYGMADLEHDVPATPDTIFEAGSVSKQFTATAVLLLARDGKLSIDDPARKYVPELPDYGQPLTIRHLLTHTSGLRDWGDLVAIGGWPRGTRVYTQAHVLDIVSRQRALNFAPGTRWSYSNTGYNLAAVIVSRVSGQAFAEFTRARIFEPLHMARTSWRDDHTRIVKGRALAYDVTADGFRTRMPLENVYGNSSLLTTVGDLLKWNENLASPVVGDAAFVAQQQSPGRFRDGRTHGYAFGLMIGEYRGLREVSHGGATAGYRAHLVRYPEPRLSVAVLCNNGAAVNAEAAAHAVADVFLPGPANEPPPQSPYRLTRAEIEAAEGLYRNRDTGEWVTVAGTGGVLRVSSDRIPTRVENALGELVSLSASRFVSANGRIQWDLGRGDAARRTDPFGTVELFERVTPWQPTSAELTAFLGHYESDEAEVSIEVAVDKGGLVLKRRPDSVVTLTPVYADTFRDSQELVRFRRDKAGAVRELSVATSRVWDLRFRRR